MSENQGRIIRRHRRRTDDGRGVRRLIAGRRFRAPAGVDIAEAELRFLAIERVWRDNEAFCHRMGTPPQWSYIALWAVEHLLKGQLRVPLPPIDDVLASHDPLKWPVSLDDIVWKYTDETLACHTPKDLDGLSWDEALKFYNAVSRAFPSINWLLPERHAAQFVSHHERRARRSLRELARVKNQSPPDPATPLVDGTFHEALKAYENERRKDFTLPDGSFDGSGHHMLGMIRAMWERFPDFPLAEMDFSRCQSLVDLWRSRQVKNLKTEAPLSKKTCGNYIGELNRFFDWLHLTSKFGWRKPEDFNSLKTRVRKLPSDRQSLDDLEIPRYTLDELVLLYKYAIPSERLYLIWCLNCAHGAAEFGRVEWEDVILHQEHPWRKQGLNLETTPADSWCGFIRPKSGVLGWWLLWPETVRLLEWWRGQLGQSLRRELRLKDRVLLTGEGKPLYRDESRNAQSGFGNAWTRLLDRIADNEDNGERAVRRLPFGTLRNQLPDWLGGEHARAVVASVALCHGIPHTGDKLLYKHYANKPWAALFRAQREYREHVQPIFDAVPNPFVEYDPVGEKVRVVWVQGERNIRKIAEQVNVSEMTVRRRLISLGIMKAPHSKQK